MEKYRLSLLENCYSFIDEALRKVYEAEELFKEWKYSILFLVQAIELALKEQLRREHPCLIYRDVEKQTLTVTIEEAIKRLRKISNIELSKNDDDIFKKAIEIRNDIIHHSFEIDLNEIRINFTILLGFLNDFISRVFNESIKDKITPNLWNQVLKRNDAYVLEIINRVEQRIKDENIVNENILPCRVCKKKYFIVEEDLGKCYFCNFQDYMTHCISCAFVFPSNRMLCVDHENNLFLCEKCKYTHHMGKPFLEIE